MTKLNGMTLWLAGALVLAPVAGWLGYEGGRIVEYQRAIKSAEHAGAALAGALEVCRSQQEARDRRPAAQDVMGLNLG